MKCKEIHKKLIVFLEGELPEQEAQKIARHLSECSDCAAFAEKMQKTLQIIVEEKSPEVSPFFFTRVKARMEAQEKRKNVILGFPLWERVLQPALFTLILVAGIYAGIRIGQPVYTETDNSIYANTELIPFLNEMDAEPIESFLME